MGYDASVWTRSLERGYTRRGLVRGGLAAAGLAGLTALGCRSSSTAKTGSAATAAPVEPVKLTVSWTGIAQEGALYSAIDQGIFKKNGLDLNLVQIPGTNAVAALLSGQVQVIGCGGGEVVASAAAGSDAVAVVVQTPVFTGDLYVTPEIKSPADLKGKKVGIALPGGTSDQTLRLALQHFGLVPDKDVTFISTGSIENQAAALLSGAIQGTNVTPGPNSVKLEAQGVKPLVNFATIGLPPAAIVVIAMKRSFITSRPDIAQRYIDSIVEGTVAFRRNRALGLKQIGTILKSDDQVGIAAAYDYVNTDVIMPLDTTPKAELFKPLQDTLCNSRKIEAACSMDLSKVIEASLVQSSVKKGLAK
ncbi:MAG TPA: ABC transporter substrate-binding protein [Dehalococcoidia bacterium]|nr:ABC transporter substrate-binding protein [Dehalococcoidia bacterium]